MFVVANEPFCCAYSNDVQVMVLLEVAAAEVVVAVEVVKAAEVAGAVEVAEAAEEVSGSPISYEHA
jgi:hypothetical protein